MPPNKLNQKAESDTIEFQTQRVKMRIKTTQRTRNRKTPIEEQTHDCKQQKHNKNIENKNKNIMEKKKREEKQHENNVKKHRRQQENRWNKKNKKENREHNGVTMETVVWLWRQYKTYAITEAKIGQAHITIHKVKRNETKHRKPYKNEHKMTINI